jgi:hypothetical protein
MLILFFNIYRSLSTLCVFAILRATKILHNVNDFTMINAYEKDKLKNMEVPEFRGLAIVSILFSNNLLSRFLISTAKVNLHQIFK